MRWGAFAAGIIIGAALSALVMAGALAERRRARRRTLPWSRRRSVRGAPMPHPRNLGTVITPGYAESAAARAARTWPEDVSIDAEIDEELAQTFPASDPLPYSHLID
jgi:hypothetical protein